MAGLSAREEPSRAWGEIREVSHPVGVCSDPKFFSQKSLIRYCLIHFDHQMSIEGRIVIPESTANTSSSRYRQLEGIDILFESL
jgi:hypothetical protein